MIRGISFKILDQWDKNLENILAGIEIEKYDWKVYFHLAYFKNEKVLYERYTSLDRPIIEDREYEGDTFRKLVNNIDYLLVALDMKVYYPGSEGKDVETYEEYLESDCQMAVLCCDWYYYEIYAKDREITDRIKKNCEANGYENIQYITDENDGRTRMRV